MHLCSNAFQPKLVERSCQHQATSRGANSPSPACSITNGSPRPRGYRRGPRTPRAGAPPPHPAEGNGMAAIGMIGVQCATISSRVRPILQPLARQKTSSWFHRNTASRSSRRRGRRRTSMLDLYDPDGAGQVTLTTVVTTVAADVHGRPTSWPAVSGSQPDPFQVAPGRLLIPRFGRRMI
jgi:hypothetical protein